MGCKNLQILFICLVLGVAQITVGHADEEIIQAGVGADFTFFGFSVAVSGDTFIGGHTSYSGNTGGAHIFRQRASGGAWVLEAAIPSPDPALKDLFGWSVALDGETAVVGANQDGGKGKDQGAGIGEGPGFVHVYKRRGTDWPKQTTLKADDGAPNDRFGTSVAISGDTVIVGSPKSDLEAEGEDAGAVYVFVRKGDIWKQQTKLTSSDGAEKDQFGNALSLEGDVAIISAFSDDDAGSKSGAAYIFVRNGETWTEEAKLTASDADGGDQFGISVDISLGLTASAIIGAHFDDDAGSKSGSAYIFKRNPDGTWGEQIKLTASDADKGDRFGYAVAIDVNRVVVGAPWADQPKQDFSGAIYSFLRVGSDWVEQKKEEAKNVTRNEVDVLTKGDNFGSAIDISNKGSVVIVGSPWDNGQNGGAQDEGSVYIYDTSQGDLGIALAVEASSSLVTTTLGQIKRSALLQNFPNPFNPETWMPYVLADDAPVTIGIYDVQGQLVRQLTLGGQPSGSYINRENAAYWDGKDQFGEPVSSGVYFYTLHAGTFQATRRMVILK